MRTLKGALYGLVVGVVANAIVFLVTIQCLPYRISELVAPAYCTGTLYQVIGYLSFPVNILTNDLAAAPAYALVSLALYALLGAIIVRRA